ncbi:MAG: hypothetical protein PUB18_00640 [bacterium]|nr:hypothetical protein [bacterium]
MIQEEKLGWYDCEIDSVIMTEIYEVSKLKEMYMANHYHSERFALLLQKNSNGFIIHIEINL